MSTLKGYLDVTVPTWSGLRRFGTSRVFQSAYFWLFFVPAAAKANESLHLSFALPFSWRVLFLSALSISLANLLFLWRAPEIVRRFSSFADFVEEGRSSNEVTRWFERLIARQRRHVELKDLKRNVTQYLQLAAVDTSALNIDSATGAMMALQRAKVPDSRGSEAFWQVYTLADDLHRGSRRASWVAYRVGLLLFAWIVVENIWFVLKPWITELWNYVQ